MNRNLPKAIGLIFVCSVWSFARELYATIFFASRPDYLLYDALGTGYLFFVLQLPYLIVASLSLWLMLKPKILAIWYFFGQLYLALLIVTLYVVAATNNIKLAQETFLIFLLSRGRDASPEVVEMLMSPAGLKIFFVIVIVFLLTLGIIFFRNRGYYLNSPPAFTTVEALEQLRERSLHVVPLIDGSRQLLTKVETEFEFSLFFDTYYLQPRPDLVGEAIVALGSSGVLADDNAKPPVAGFFSEIFAANPGRLADWHRRFEGQDQHTQSTLGYASSLSKAGGVLGVGGHSCQLNDLYWGAFFASGNTSYVKKIIEQVRFIDERDDILLFMTGATAKWSLASVAQTHDRVRSTLETARAGTNGRGRKIITDILTQDPALIQQEWQEIVARQRAAGKWSGVLRVGLF